MRILYAIPLLLLGACQVSEDDQNDAVTVQYSQNVAENAAQDIANGAEEAGQAIANGARDVGNAARNVDVDVDTNTADDNRTTNSN